MLTVVQRDNHLKAARVTTVHGEGARGDYIFLKVGGVQVMIEREEFRQLAEGVLALPRGPEMKIQDVSL